MTSKITLGSIIQRTLTSLAAIAAVSVIFAAKAFELGPGAIEPPSAVATAQDAHTVELRD